MYRNVTKHAPNKTVESPVLSHLTMSNLVDQAALQKNRDWMTPTSNAYPTGANVVPVSTVPKVSNAQGTTNNYREFTTKLNVLFSGSLREMNDKCVTQCMSAQNASLAFRAQGAATPHNVQLTTDSPNDSKPDLTKAIITGITILSTHNTFPVTTRFDWTGQGESATACDMEGKQFPLQLYPGESSRGLRINIYDAKSAVSDPLFRKYGHVSLKAMWDRIQILPTPEGPIALVPPDHDALKLIQLNPQRFGSAPSEADLVLNSFYRMSPKTIGFAIDEMYTNILSKFKFTDLSKFSVTMSRADGRDFSDLSGTGWAHLEEADKANFKNKILTAGFEMEIAWICPQPENSRDTSNFASPPSSQSFAIPSSATGSTLGNTQRTMSLNSSFNPYQSSTFGAQNVVPVSSPQKL